MKASLTHTLQEGLPYLSAALACQALPRLWRSPSAVMHMQIIHMANDSSLLPSKPDAAADAEFLAGSGLASATPSSTMRGALEAMHSVDLGHPNIVQTYKSTQRAVQARPPSSHSPNGPVMSSVLYPVRLSLTDFMPADTCIFHRLTAGRPPNLSDLLTLRTVPSLQSGQDERSNMGYPDQESGGKQFTETWLVLEYCDRGNLQDAVDRGVFVLQRGPQAAANGTAPESNCNVRSVRWVSQAL